MGSSCLVDVRAMDIIVFPSMASLFWGAPVQTLSCKGAYHVTQLGGSYHHLVWFFSIFQCCLCRYNITYACKIHVTLGDHLTFRDFGCTRWMLEQLMPLFLCLFLSGSLYPKLTTGFKEYSTRAICSDPIHNVFARDNPHNVRLYRFGAI